MTDWSVAQSVQSHTFICRCRAVALCSGALEEREETHAEKIAKEEASNQRRNKPLHRGCIAVTSPLRSCLERQWTSSHAPSLMHAPAHAQARTRVRAQVHIVEELDDRKPLMSVQELAKGVQYFESMKTGWVTDENSSADTCE